MVAVLLLSGAGLIYLSFFPRTTTIYVAAADLPAYWPVQQRDVRQLSVSSRNAPDDAITSRGNIVGRYTLRPVGQDTAFRSSAVGPEVPVETLERDLLVALPGNSETALGGQLRAGDRVDVALSPERIDGRSGVLTDVLVVDVRTSPPSVVLALDREEQALLSELAGTTLPVLLRRPPSP
jgi:Flp pilus assembly protein CpaB